MRIRGLCDRSASIAVGALMLALFGGPGQFALAAPSMQGGGSGGIIVAIPTLSIPTSPSRPVSPCRSIP